MITHCLSRNRATTVAAVVALALATACGGGKSGNRAPSAAGSAPRNSGASGSAEVTYRPNVRVVEQNEGTNALVSVSTDGSTLVFDHTRGNIPSLAVGDVLLIKGLLARKVIAEQTDGHVTAVLTVPAGLGELVADGKIRLQVPIRFGKARTAAALPTRRSPWEMLTNGLVAPLYAQSPTEDRRRAAEQNGVNDAYGNLARAPFKALMSGWETEFSAEPADGRVNLHLKMTKSLGNVTAVVEGTGYLADFDFSSDIDVERSTVEKMQVAYKKLNGLMDFTWVIQTTEGGALRGNAAFKLPAAIEIPLYQYLGGLPLYLEISSAVLIKPGIGASYAFSRGAFRVTYDGYQTFSVMKGVADADGSVTGDVKLLASENGSATPSALILTFAAPRIELSIGVSKVLKFEGIKEGAAQADKYFDMLAERAFGAEGLAKFKSSPLSKVTATKIVDDAMGSEAAAHLELITTSGTSHTGNAVLNPCTRTDLHMWVKVGASAKALGESVGSAEKEIYKKDFTKIDPPNDALCKNL